MEMLLPSAHAPGPVRDSLNRERLRVRTHVEGTPRLFAGSEDCVVKVERRDSAGRVRLRRRRLAAPPQRACVIHVPGLIYELSIRYDCGLANDALSMAQ